VVPEVKVREGFSLQHLIEEKQKYFFLKPSSAALLRAFSFSITLVSCECALTMLTCLDWSLLAKDNVTANTSQGHSCRNNILFADFNNLKQNYIIVCYNFSSLFYFLSIQFFLSSWVRMSDRPRRPSSRWNRQWWCRVFQSRIFHACVLVPRFLVSRFPFSRFQRPTWASSGRGIGHFSPLETVNAIFASALRPPEICSWI